MSTQNTNLYASCYLSQTKLQSGLIFSPTNNRKGVVAEYFLLLLFFLLFKFIKQRLQSKKENEEKEVERPTIAKFKKSLKALENFDTKFLTFYSNHICCSVMAIIWSPYDFTLVAVYFVLVCFILYCIAGEIYENQTLKTVFYCLIAVANIGLIVSGCRGLYLQQQNIILTTCQM